MTSFRAAAYLLDARNAALSICGFTENRTQADYKADPLLQAAVERQFITLGEAFARLREFAPEIAGQITELPKIIGFRNRLIHRYGEIDNAIVWTTVREELPQLIARIGQSYDGVPKP